MNKLLIISSFLCWNSVFNCDAAPNSLSLELIQVIFRHGDRYPTENERKFVGSDSLDYFFQNFKDFGQLTRAGKLLEYNLGKMLRQMYGHWLGDFKSHEVYAYSTHYDRTKASLLLVLAGLYPPSQTMSWSNELNWSPIPTHYNKSDNDDLFLVVKNPACGIDKLGISKYPEVAQKMEAYRNFYEQLKTKINIKEFKSLTFLKLYSYIRAVIATGLALPNWCTPEGYKKLEEITKIHFNSFGMTVASRKATAGPMVDQILHNIKNNQKAKRKLYLYSCHENNIASFLQSHNVTGVPTNPDFGSAIIIDTLRRDNGQRYLRMVYWTGVSSELLPVRINDDKQLLSLVKYSEIVKPMIPNDEEKSCYLRPDCNNNNSH